MCLLLNFPDEAVEENPHGCERGNRAKWDQVQVGQQNYIDEKPISYSMPEARNTSRSKATAAPFAG